MKDSTCNTPDCERKILARGMCPTHYNVWFKIENAERNTFTCVHCGEEFKTWRAKQASCSLLCQRKYQLTNHRTQLRKAKGQALVLYAPKPAPPNKVTTIPGGYFTMGWCTQCGTQFVDRNTVMVCSEACQRERDSCRRRDARHRRRALRRGAFVDRVYKRVIYERDNFICQLCRKAVDMTAVVPSHRAPTLDHIIPLSRGGSHEPSNVQLACFICNSIKGDLKASATMF